MKKTATPVTNTVMKQIKRGDVAMHSHAYFTLLFAAATAGVLLAGLVGAYLFSIMFFWLRIETAGTMAWGARANLSAAIESFPWWALVVAAAAFTFAVMLMRRQGTMYRHRTSTVLIFLILATLLAGFVLSYWRIGGTHLPGMPQPGHSNNVPGIHGPRRTGQAQ